MLTNIRYSEVKVRRPNSHLFRGEDKFTGTVTYSVIGSVDHLPVRMSLGTEEKTVAIRRIRKLEQACAEGPISLLWHELDESLPVKTFKFFADRVGYVGAVRSVALQKASWRTLTDSFDLEMARMIANKQRGASRNEGTISESTRGRYQHIVRLFSAFITTTALLDDITPTTIETYKSHRFEKIGKLKQSRGGSGVALEIAVLHRIFKYGVKKQLMLKNPIDLANESKPGENPKNGARPFNADELAKLRKVAGDDRFMFLLLLKTGLRGSDAVNLTWQNIQFDRGTNGEIEVVTQKRTKIAIIPLVSELRDALEELHRQRRPRLTDQVLHNPETNKPFGHRSRLYERTKKMGVRAGVERVTPHCFRDTFACDSLTRGVSIFDVAKMLADTVETIEDYYAEFVPAARDAAQNLMETGVGIEERAQMSERRKQKVVSFRGR